MNITTIYIYVTIITSDVIKITLGFLPALSYLLPESIIPRGCSSHKQQRNPGYPSSEASCTTEAWLRSSDPWS